MSFSILDSGNVILCVKKRHSLWRHTIGKSAAEYFHRRLLSDNSLIFPLSGRRMYLTVFLRALSEHFREGTDKVGTVLIAYGLTYGGNFLLTVFQKLAGLV